MHLTILTAPYLLVTTVCFEGSELGLRQLTTVEKLSHLISTQRTEWWRAFWNFSPFFVSWLCLCVWHIQCTWSCVCAHVCKCTHRYESWMSMKSHPLFPETESLPKTGATDWWFWLDGKPQESSCLQSSPPAADITDTHCRASHERVHWGTDACGARSLSTEQSLPSRELIYFFVCVATEALGKAFIPHEFP